MSAKQFKCKIGKTNFDIAVSFNFGWIGSAVRCAFTRFVCNFFYKSMFSLFQPTEQADWSEQFVFNVHARSISPCDPHTGIGVLFEYPACILDRADRIRLFGKLRADVASLAPPTR